jgi:coenzyme F420-reducing hydrogenase beta subunit
LGGIGQDGWTFTVVRTDIGLKLYERLLAKNLIEVKRLDSDEEAVKAKQLLIKLSTQKRNRPKSYNR